MTSSGNQIDFLNALFPKELPETVRQTSLSYLQQLCLPLLEEWQRAGEMTDLPTEYLTYPSQNFQATTTDRAAGHF